MYRVSLGEELRRKSPGAERYLRRGCFSLLPPSGVSVLLSAGLRVGWAADSASLFSLGCLGDSDMRSISGHLIPNIKPRTITYVYVKKLK